MHFCVTFSCCRYFYDFYSPDIFSVRTCVLVSLSVFMYVCVGVCVYLPFCHIVFMFYLAGFNSAVGMG